MTTVNLDLTKLTCRVCLQSSHDEMSSIFDVDTDFYDICIYEKIEQCAGIKVLRHEKMPTLICGDCYGFLKISYRFRIICRNSNEYLKEFVAIDLANTKIEEYVEQNPLLIQGNARIEEDKLSKNKSKLKYKPKTSFQPIETCQDSSTCSPITKPEDYVEYNINEGEVEAWFVGNEEDISRTENVEASVEKINSYVKTEKVNNISIQHKKNTFVKEEKNNTTPSKTLEISSDGAAIIREKKPHTKSEKKDKQPHICDVCGNIYQRRYALELHVRRHRDEKPYECEICSYAFHSNFELIRHMRKHTGSRPYKCSYCYRAFGDQSTLIKHERIHRNERPFTCDTCGKSFTYSNVLKHHKLTHTGEKPYSCELCGKSFTRPHHLRAHLETLQHLSDPRSKILLQNIRKNNDDEISKVENFTVKI